MNESISRAAGNQHGQEMGPREMESLITAIGRKPVQRTTLYQSATGAQREKSFSASTLTDIVQSPAGKYARTRVSLDRPSGTVR